VKTPHLDTLVMLQRPVKVRDDKGGEVVTPTDVEQVWIHSEPSRVGERLAASLVQGMVALRIELRYRTDITAGWRLKTASGQTAEVAGPPVDPDGQRRWLRLECVSERWLV